MNISRIHAWQGIVLLALCAACLPARAVDVYTHSIGEQVDVVGDGLRGKPHGGKRAYQVELVRALMAEMQLPDAMRVVPFARGMMMTQETKGMAFFNVVRTVKREKQLHWVVPLMTDIDFLFESATAPKPLKRLDQARQRTVCVLRDSVYDHQFTDQGYKFLVRVPVYDTCLKMLKVGRVDLIATSTDNLQEFMKMVGMEPEEVRRTDIVVGKTTGYLVMSKDTPLDEVKRWQDAFERLNQRKAPQKLYEQFYK
jgi:polar amino acid transport system substrate-binding protein